MPMWHFSQKHVEPARLRRPGPDYVAGTGRGPSQRQRRRRHVQAPPCSQERNYTQILALLVGLAASGAFGLESRAQSLQAVLNPKGKWPGVFISDIKVVGRY